MMGVKANFTRAEGPPPRSVSPAEVAKTGVKGERPGFPPQGAVTGSALELKKFVGGSVEFEKLVETDVSARPAPVPRPEPATAPRCHSAAG
mgnify:CR=1 FL=1